MKLSARQERFCQEYAVTGNGSKAALADLRTRLQAAGLLP